MTHSDDLPQLEEVPAGEGGNLMPNVDHGKAVEDVQLPEPEDSPPSKGRKLMPEVDKGKAVEDGPAESSMEHFTTDPYGLSDLPGIIITGSSTAEPNEVNIGKETQKETVDVQVQKASPSTAPQSPQKSKGQKSKEGGAMLGTMVTAVPQAPPQVRDAPSVRGNPTPCKGGKLVVMNVHGTLIDLYLLGSQDYAIEKPTLTTDRQGILFRPWLTKFLAYCFNHFTVAFWGMASRAYMRDTVSVILGCIQGKGNRVPLFIWGKEDAHIRTPDGKPFTWGKPLDWIFSRFPQWNHSNTVLVDTEGQKFEVNPLSNMIVPPHFYADRLTKLADDMQYLWLSLKPQLEGFLQSSSMEDFLTRFPNYRELDEMRDTVRCQQVTK